jgi:hypothetical protein
MNSKTRILLSRAGLVSLCARDRRVIARVAQRAGARRADANEARRTRRRAHLASLVAMALTAAHNLRARLGKLAGASRATSTWRAV